MPFTESHMHDQTNWWNAKRAKNTHLNLNIVSTMSRHRRQKIARNNSERARERERLIRATLVVTIQWRNVTVQSMGGQVIFAKAQCNYCKTKTNHLLKLTYSCAWAEEQNDFRRDRERGRGVAECEEDLNMMHRRKQSIQINCVPACRHS